LSFRPQPDTIRRVSDPSQLPTSSLLSALDLGPAWARQSAAPSQGRPDAPSHNFPEDKGRDRRDDNNRRDQGNRSQGRDAQRIPGRGRDFRDDRRNDRRGDTRDDRRDQGRIEHEYIEAAPGVRVLIQPAAAAVQLVAKEVHHVARVYSLFDVSNILLARRDRCTASFEAADSRPPLLHGKLDGSLWLTREEAIAHFWQAPWRTEFYEEETVEVPPPTGNFQVVARCGMSGEWLGPPNFHTYQTALRRIHRERFSHMRFEAYTAKVRTERGEEAVNAWLDTMKSRVRWKAKGTDEELSFDDRASVERHFAAHRFADAFEETRRAEVSADIPARNLSPSLLTSLRGAGTHAKQHPAVLIPVICRMLEAAHLPVFKRDGRLYTGPARPRSLSPETILAERPAAIVHWLAATPKATLKGLWKEVLPDGQTEPCKEWLADLFWLLTEGFVLLFSDDKLSLQHRRDPAAGAPGKPAAKTAKLPPAKKSAAPQPGTAKPAKKRRRKKPRRRKIAGHPPILTKLRAMGFAPRQLKTIGYARPSQRLRLAKRLIRHAGDQAESE
jgi:hypothetical protein